MKAILCNADQLRKILIGLDMVSRAGIHSQIFVVLVLVLSSCYSQSRLAIGFLCCYSFLTPEAFFLGEGGFVYD